jgi:tRNA (guanosine-2'-O-)-methyltransferase
MDTKTKKELIAYLSSFVTSHKLELMNQVIKNRTRRVTIVLEDVFQPHNMSAAIRSAECFGVQDVHIIEQQQRFKPNINISRGASNWITLHHYDEKNVNNVERCFAQLRENNYRIIATSPSSEKSFELSQIPLNSKIALVFGTEETGISDYVRDHADACVTIPMFGFTESFNISVSVALCLYDITMRLRASQLPWSLSEEEKTDIYLQWLRTIIRGADLLERRFLGTTE